MRRLALALLSAVAGMVLLAVVGLAPASAQTCPDPAVELDPASVRAGGSVTVTGTGFDPACASGAGPHSPDVALTLVQGDRTVNLTTARARAGATSFEVEVDIPSDVQAGSATVRAQGAAGNATAPIQLTVSTPVSGGQTATTTTSTTAPAGVAGEGDLASTGFEAAALVGFALALVVAGLAIEWVAQTLPARV